jgi:hypothetical protein
MYINSMDKRKYFDELSSYLRSVRPREHLEFDRAVSILLAWFDAHSIRDMESFSQNTGRDYEMCMAHLTRKLGHEFIPPPDFLKTLYKYARLTR